MPPKSEQLRGVGVSGPWSTVGGRRAEGGGVGVVPGLGADVGESVGSDVEHEPNTVHYQIPMMFDTNRPNDRRCWRWSVLPSVPHLLCLPRYETVNRLLFPSDDATFRDARDRTRQTVNLWINRGSGKGKG